jgi:hypothetical protein
MTMFLGEVIQKHAKQLRRWLYHASGHVWPDLFSSKYLRPRQGAIPDD